MGKQKRRVPGSRLEAVGRLEGADHEKVQKVRKETDCPGLACAVVMLFALTIPARATIGLRELFPVMPSENSLTKEIILDAGLNEFNARTAVMDYFKGRTDFLQSKREDIPAVPAIVLDENIHRELLRDKDLLLTESQILIDDVHCDDYCMKMDITETVAYLSGDVTYNEVIKHEITIYSDENEELVVASDAYQEVCTDFYSCSFVKPPEESFSLMAAGGSKYCIINVARAEVGYRESGTNITKYGSWYGSQNEWCAMFVAWCANQANISTTIIPKTASAPGMKNTFAQKGRFYLSQSQGGSTAPMAGDIFFEGTSANGVQHVGIITSVDSNNIYVVDGNCDNKVNSHAISRTASNFVGFARPQYASTSHSSGTSWYSNASYHWHQCANCSEAMSKTRHTFNKTGVYYVCAVCGYKTTNISEISGKVPDND